VASLLPEPDLRVSSDHASHPVLERLELLLFAFLGVHLLFIADSVVDNVVELNLEGDWWHLYTVGLRVWDGTVPGVYDIDINAKMFWRYPPFCLYGAAVLAIGPPAVGYWTQVALQVCGVGLVAWLLRARKTHLVVLAIVASAPLHTTVGAGQNSGVLLAVIVSGSILWSQGRSVAGGIVLGLLAAKPNWGLPFGVFALLVRDWQAAVAMLSTAAALTLASLPLGPGLWVDFVMALTHHNELVARYPPSRMITLWSTLQPMLPALAAHVLWWSGLAAMVAALAQIVRRDDRLHQLGALTLFSVACNQYASFYDALVLIFPALLWWRRGTRTAVWWGIGGVILATWIAAHAATSYGQLLGSGDPPFALTGVLTTLWLILEAVERRTPS